MKSTEKFSLHHPDDLMGDFRRMWTYVEGARLDLGVQLVLVLIPEGRVAHQQDVQYDV